MKRSRNFAITLNYRFFDNESFCNLIEYISESHAVVRGFVLGALELGEENEYAHAHAMVVFKNPQRLDDVIGYFPKLHVESVVSVKEYRKYMKKDGPFQIDTLLNYSPNDDILSDMDCCTTFSEFMRMHPELVSQIRNWERMWFLLSSTRTETNGEDNN